MKLLGYRLQVKDNKKVLMRKIVKVDDLIIETLPKALDSYSIKLKTRRGEIKLWNNPPRYIYEGEDEAVLIAERPIRRGEGTFKNVTCPGRIAGFIYPYEVKDMLNYYCVSFQGRFAWSKDPDRLMAKMLTHSIVDVKITLTSNEINKLIKLTKTSKRWIVRINEEEDRFIIETSDFHYIKPLIDFYEQSIIAQQMFIDQIRNMDLFSNMKLAYVYEFDDKFHRIHITDSPAQVDIDIVEFCIPWQYQDVELIRTEIGKNNKVLAALKTEDWVILCKRRESC